ncbi:hypothetical protein FHS85_005108 [Rhodoligotrophos appendicifer]|uniref:hypothetical protein n=1 Tax=Rhodoligotrophos appendicifer TaxID=987056 RepID=UPI00117F8FB7|nr:hypothetical protein [Rhodoligotrophos appendicifer]
MTRGPVFTLILASFILWSVAFLLLYGLQATGCRMGWHDTVILNSVSLLRLMMAGLTLVVLMVLAALLRRLPGEASEPFMRDVATYLSIAALVSAAFSFAGTFWLTLC